MLNNIAPVNPMECAYSVKPVNGLLVRRGEAQKQFAVAAGSFVNEDFLTRFLSKW